MSEQLKHIAFLGPAGTHTELALKSFLPDAHTSACFSISDIFRMVAEKKADAGFVPIENLIHGTVTETLDALLTYKRRVFISASHLMPIRNALGVLADSVTKDGKSQPIHTVCSHEQALRQCSRYLAEQFPEAERKPLPSTAAAIQFVKSTGLAHAAVIAAKDSLLEQGFKILADDISDLPDNKTRFVLIEAGDSEAILAKGAPPARFNGQDEPCVTSIILDPKRDRQGLLVEVLNVISVQHHINLLGIHSRPDAKGGFVFYFDLEGRPGQANIDACLAALRRFCVDATGETVEISLLGFYPRLPFYALPFQSVGIIGGEGKMGRWLSEFFRSAGLRVVTSDRSSPLSSKALVSEVDVVVLSVPMHAAKEVTTELLPHLRAGQLVVENCSVKSCALPLLENSAPEGVEVLGIHTMFGGDVIGLRDQNIILTPTKRSGALSRSLEDLLYKHGAKITHSAVAEHDRISALLQSLVQLELIAFGDVCGREFQGKEELEVFSTPNSRAILQALSKVLNQSDDLIFDLQTQNENALKIRNKFLESIHRLVSGLNHNDLRAFREALAHGRRFLQS